MLNAKEETFGCGVAGSTTRVRSYFGWEEYENAGGLL